MGGVVPAGKFAGKTSERQLPGGLVQDHL